MKVRIKFQKYGPMKFIGHLDVMRYFQKAFRRAELDSEYTKGFNPHQVMSFASPLGLGLTSDGEYMDIGLNFSDSPKLMVKKINGVMSEGFKVVGYRILEEPLENVKNVTAMSLVSSSDYMVSLKDGYSLGDMITCIDEFKAAFLKFVESSEIIISKKTKKSEKLVDIKPMISFVAFDEAEYKNKLKDVLLDMPISVDVAPSHVKDADSDGKSGHMKDADSDGKSSYKMDADTDGKSSYKMDADTDGKSSYMMDAESRAEVYDNGIKVYMQLDTGSESNLKPELVIEAFCNANNIEYNPYAWQHHRLEMYTRDDKTKKLISLDRLER
ncbi:MAG: DUF2344 domain-containing protein [Clostridiales bacterium]|nr:DUF2344 domain-containing protein [Clostridiales bacterium]